MLNICLDTDMKYSVCYISDGGEGGGGGQNIKHTGNTKGTTDV